MRCLRRVGAALLVVGLTASGGSDLPHACAGPGAAGAETAGAIRGYVLVKEDRPLWGASAFAVERPEPARRSWSGDEDLDQLFAARPFRQTRALAEALTGKDGSFLLTGLVAGREYDVWTHGWSGMPFARVTVRAEVDPPARVVFRPWEGVRWRLRIQGAGGVGLPAVLKIERSPDAPDDVPFEQVHHTTDGNVTQRDAPAGMLEVTAVVPDVGLLRAPLLVPTDGVAALSLTDEQGGTIEGTVRDGKGTPVRDARLAWEVERREGRLVRLARTDADGRFRLEHVPAGPARLARVDAPGLLLDEVGALRWSSLGVYRGAVATAEVRLAHASTVTGTVRDPKGAPVVGAEVRLETEERGAEQHARTGPDGRYAFEGLSSGQGWLTVPAFEPLVPSRLPSGPFTREGARAPFELATAGTKAVQDFTVTSGVLSPLVGVVRDEAGTPVPGAWVHVERWLRDGGPTPEVRVRTGPDGRFEVPPPSPYPEWGVEATADGKQSERVIARLGGKPLELVLDAAKPRAASLSGRVVNAAGAPLAGALVVPCEEPQSGGGAYGGPHATAPGVITDAEGRFVLRDLSGKITLQIQHRGTWLHRLLGRRSRSHSPDLVWHDVYGGADVKDVVETTLPTGALGGVVVDEQGRAVPGTWVQLRLEQQGLGKLRGQDVPTNREGRFRAPYLVEGLYEVVLRDGPRETPPPKIRTGTLDAKLVLRAQPPRPTRSVSLRVLGPDGAPVPLARMRPAYGLRLVGGSRVVVDGRLEAVLEREQPGARLSLGEAFDAAGQPLGTLEANLEVPEGDAPLPAEIRLEAGDTVAGRVLDEAQKGVGGVLVALAQADAFGMDRDELEPPWALSRDDGSFRFTGLHGTDRLLRVLPLGDEVEPEPIPIPEGGKQDVRVVLVGGARIGGRTVNGKGEPALAAVQVTWSDAAGVQRRDLSTDRGGAFLLVVPKGAQDVAVRADEGPRMPHGFGMRIPGWPFAVAQGVKPGTLDLVLRMTSGDALRGTVVGPQGEPIASGWVLLLAEAQDPPARENPFGFEATRPFGGIRNGTFELTTAPPGKRRVVAIPESEDYGPSGVVAVEVPGEGVRIAVPRSVAVTFSLVGAGGKEFFATWGGAAADGSRLWRQSLSDAEGRFTLKLPPDVPGRLYVKGREDDRYALVKAVSGSTPSPVAVTLSEGTSIRGSVEGITAQEAQGGRILLHGGDLHTTARLEPDATFHARGLPPGDYEITVEVPAGASFAMSDKPQVVAAGSTGVVIRTGIRRVQRR